MHEPLPIAELAGLLVAITGLLTVVLVQARKTAADVRRMDAETRAMLARIDDNAAATKDQTTNAHGTNLRDDIDDTRRAIEYLTAEHGRTAELLTGLATDMREVRSSVARLDSNAHDTHRDLDRRLRSLEHPIFDQEDH